MPAKYGTHAIYTMQDRLVQLEWLEVMSHKLVSLVLNGDPNCAGSFANDPTRNTDRPVIAQLCEAIIRDDLRENWLQLVMRDPKGAIDNVSILGLYATRNIEAGTKFISAMGILTGRKLS